MPENCGKKGILGTETPRTGLPDPAHDKEPQVVGNRNGEPVNNIAHIRVQGEQAPGRYIRAGTGLFPEILSAFRDRDDLPGLFLRDTQRHREVLLGVAVNSKHPEPFPGKQVGEDGGERGLANSSLPGDHNPYPPGPAR